MRMPSTASWVTGVSLTATATDLCTEVATAWRTVGRGWLSGWVAPLPSTAGKQGGQADAAQGVQHSPLS